MKIFDIAIILIVPIYLVSTNWFVKRSYRKGFKEGIIKANKDIENGES